MNRRELTHKNALLTLDMIAEGEQPIDDYLKRGDTDQADMFRRGLSKCDGVVKRSPHQDAKAIDKYLCTVGVIDGQEAILVNWEWNPDKAKYWHDVWVNKYGGKPMVHWPGKDGKEVYDYPHFE